MKQILIIFLIILLAGCGLRDQLLEGDDRLKVEESK